MGDYPDIEPTAPSRWARAPRALWRRSGPRIVVLPPGATTPLLLTGAGEAIWELLENPRDESSLVSELASVSGAPRDRVRDEVRMFLADLASHDAVVTPTGSDAAAPGPADAEAADPGPPAATAPPVTMRRRTPIDLGDDPDNGEIEGLVAAVATYGLPGAPAQLVTAPVAPTAWQPLVSRVQTQRLAGFLLAAVEDGALAVTDEQHEEALALHLGACGSVLRLEHRLLEVVDALEAAGIGPVVALKGSVLAHLAYPDPALRSFGDVDVLVPGTSLHDALEVLRHRFEATRQVPELRPGYDRRFTKGVTLRCADGLELDVHRTLVFATLGFRIDLDELLTATQEVRIGDRSVRALAPAALLLHACYHAGLGDPRPRYGSVRDLAQLLSTDPDPQATLDLARRWDALAVVKRGVHLCREVLDVEVAGPIAEAVDAYRPTQQEARAVASYVGRNRSHAAKVRASLPYLDGRADRAAFIIGSLVPSREFVRRRRLGWTGWLRKGMASLRRR